ncbi:MAG: leucyl aminopeptidase [Actinomycetales bacterium]|nr:leucyl aminopeptidase [Actinomycetales bacterium]
MTLALATTSPATTACDALVIAVMPQGPATPEGSGVELAAHGLPDAALTAISSALTALGAKGKPGEVTRIPSVPGVKAPVVIAVGVGNLRATIDTENLRRAVGAAIRSAVGMRKVAIVAAPQEDLLAATAMGARLAAYDFTDFKGKGSAKATAGSSPVASIVLLVPGPATAAQKRLIADTEVIGDAVCLARDLVNTPPNALPPAKLALAAKDAVAGLPVKVTIWDERALARHGCGGILGVGQGSANPPRLARLDYAPAGAKRQLIIVGKGITFDTGGISIKPAANMDEMKGDMAGAAAVIAAVQAIARLGLKVKVTGLVPTAENMPSGTAQRPGDVITMFDGTTVEVLNTDAEGRLILADALGIAVQDKPALIIDVATLTGAQRVALGSRTAGVMANDDAARAQVCAAADRAGETMWPMPLPEELRASLDSATADIANIGDRMGGMLSAAVFLKEFIPNGQPWVHLDIAGPAFNDKSPYGYTPKGGTGAAVRTFVQVARELAAG